MLEHPLLGWVSVFKLEHRIACPDKGTVKAGICTNHPQKGMARGPHFGKNNETIVLNFIVNFLQFL